MRLAGLVSAVLGRRTPPPCRLTEAQARAIAADALQGRESGPLVATTAETQGRVVWHLHTSNKGFNTFATIDDATGQVTEAGQSGGPYFVYTERAPQPRPACRLTESDAHDIARTAIEEWPAGWKLWSRQVASEAGRIVWRVSTAPVGPGTIVHIDDATGKVVRVDRRPAR